MVGAQVGLVFNDILFFLARRFDALGAFDDHLFRLIYRDSYFNVEVHVESLTLFVEVVVQSSLFGLS